MAENKSFSLLAVGHYDAEKAVVSIHLHSQNPAKQAIELDCLETGVAREIDRLRAQISYAQSSSALGPADRAPIRFGVTLG